MTGELKFTYKKNLKVSCLPYDQTKTRSRYCMELKEELISEVANTTIEDNKG